MLLSLRSDLRADAVRMMRVIRYAGPFCHTTLAKEFLSGDINDVEESGLFVRSVEDGFVISAEGMRVLEAFDPKPRA